MKHLIWILCVLCMAACAGVTDEDVNMITGHSQSGDLTTKQTPAIVLPAYYTNPIGSQSGFTMQAELKEPGNYTVQFSVTGQRSTIINGGALSGTGGITPVASITWNVNGNQVNRLVSVINGTSVTGMGEFVKCHVYDDTDITNGTPQQSYTVTASVARGSRAATTQPPVYIQNITDATGNVLQGAAYIPAASALEIDVPQNAGITSVLVTAYNNDATHPTDLTVDQIISIGSIKTYPAGLGIWMPLSPQVESIILTNRLVGAFGHDVLFSVTWGIDG